MSAAIVMPAVQSAYRPFHLTETAVVSLLNDVLGVLDQGHFDLLIVLDLSATFDTIEHTILMDAEQ